MDQPNDAGERIPDGPIHEFFELSYAQYLAIPRTFLQSMPLDWQEQFVECLRELDNAFDWRPPDGTQYRVTLHMVYPEHADEPMGYWGPEIDDPFADYERGRRRIVSGTVTSRTTDIPASEMTLWQLHYVYRDGSGRGAFEHGTRDWIWQFDRASFATCEDYLAALDKIKEDHPLPEGAVPEMVRRDNKHFLLAAAD